MNPRGFSKKTCNPLSIAFGRIIACSLGGSAIETASTEENNSSGSSVAIFSFNEDLIFLAFYMFPEQTPTKRNLGSLEKAGICTLSP